MTNIDVQYQQGKGLRKLVPRSSHALFTRASDVDPISILLSQETGRIESLIPVRHARMGESAYAFYRAGAKLMAADLASTPTSNIVVQASGDAHLANFGWYGSPERNLVFDTNDFDETLPASFEWDLKRLAASFAIASADNGFDASDQEASARACGRAYRDAMVQFASMGYLDTWYSQISADSLLEGLTKEGDSSRVKDLEHKQKKAKRKDSKHVLRKIAEQVDGVYRIRENRPWVVPLRSMSDDVSPDDISELVTSAMVRYVGTLPDHVADLLKRYTIVDSALKVVGVGSVGTRCFIVLLEGRDPSDPLFLQLKQAGDSVLADYFSPSMYPHAGERVVAGQRLMQSNTDSFLGWTSGPDQHEYYVRQLKDMKASVDVGEFGPKRMRKYAKACAWTLAHSHTRSGEPAVLSGYMGSGGVFAEAVTEFAVKYKAQNELDWKAFSDQVGFGSEGSNP